MQYTAFLTFFLGATLVIATPMAEANAVEARQSPTCPPGDYVVCGTCSSGKCLTSLNTSPLSSCDVGSCTSNTEGHPCGLESANNDDFDNQWVCPGAYPGDP
ncbi:hypothetical protein G7Y89_g3284 [Cudoniella acicularis]|uniref:Uncharacterized protein n=1 Tax=Cudoniella acicularis TaxID=354080 RepID=A0A8H4RRP0_9HELO|nr:hypothetical protein G7Y89_g3284 [Cudoniella acicularis]